MSNSGPNFDKMRYARYASFKNPEERINHLYLWHTPRSLVIREEHPKSKYHFILIPRVGAPPRVPANLENLHTLLHSTEVSKSEAETILREIREDAEVFKARIEKRMKVQEGFVWDIWMGFKINPSYKYLHLHIISDDLLGEGLKRSHHFFSFHPEHGEFYPIDEVLSWFEIVPERFRDNVRALERRPASNGREYDCYYNNGGIECLFVAKDLSTMRAHLEQHWERRQKDALDRERARKKFEQDEADRKAKLAEKGALQDKEHDGMEVEP